SSPCPSGSSRRASSTATRRSTSRPLPATRATRRRRSGRHDVAVASGGRPDIDYRFSLANERTFLAWIRTALALVAGGVAAAKALDFHHEVWRWVIAGPPILAAALAFGQPARQLAGRPARGGAHQQPRLQRRDAAPLDGDEERGRLGHEWDVTALRRPAPVAAGSRERSRRSPRMFWSDSTTA